MTSDPYGALVEAQFARSTGPKNVPSVEEALEIQRNALRLKGAVPFKDAWEFMKTACFTRDEASKRIRKFADNDGWGEERFDYLKYLTYERPKERINAYEKSRRMLITWWLICIYLYDLMTETNDLSAIASDKMEKSAYLLGSERMQLVYDLIPPVTPVVLERLQAMRLDTGPFTEEIWPNKPEIIFAGKQGTGWKEAACAVTNSRCMAVAAGTSQMQQYTFSKVLLDEFSRWQWAEDSWRNIQPVLQGGGRADIVCTAELGSFAYDLLYDIEIS